ncbi:TPA: hypothetical protein HA265_04150 [Candidatus Woesearchaeota archaeon]|nr:hypothetical protein [Candidatus Woesearchaeota archaeon]
MVVENATVMLAGSINQTAPSFIDAPLAYAKDTLIPRITDMMVAPADNPDALWTLGPMMLSLVLMQLYFGRNKDEDLGWNTAFGNSIALTFISVSLLRGLFLLSGETDIMMFLTSIFHWDNTKIIVIVLLFAYGMLLAAISFFHWIPEKLAFFMMNGISINVTAYVVIVLVNSENIPLDWHTVFAGMLIFVGVYSVFAIFRSIVPSSLNSKIKLWQRKKFILDVKVRVCERKAREANSDEKKAKFNRKARDYKVRADACQKVIDDLKKEL